MQEADLRVMSPTDSLDVVGLPAVVVDAVAATPGACSDRGLGRRAGFQPFFFFQGCSYRLSAELILVSLQLSGLGPGRLASPASFPYRLFTEGIFSLLRHIRGIQVGLPTEIISIHLKLMLPAWRHHPVEEFS